MSFLLGLLVVGCGGSSDGRLPLASQVFLEGQPFDRGSIEFHPRTAEGTMTGGMISGGSFEIPADQGAKPGLYQVRVFAAGDAVEVDPNEPPGPESQIYTLSYCNPIRGMPCDVATTANPAMFASHSLHPGGVNAALGDGSVRFFSNSIVLDTWRALSTANGGESFEHTE